jgi:MFS family permease
MSEQHDPFSALRHKEFRYFVSGKLVLTVAILMQEIIASWLIYAKTHDPLSLGLIGLAEAIPALGLALPGGHLADKLNRRLLMIGATFLMLAASVFLTIYIFYLQGIGIWPAYLTIFLVGTARGIYNPAQSSFWTMLVPKNIFVNSSVWNSSMWQIGAVSGPALGGLCYGWIGPGKAMIVVCVLICTTLFFYSLIDNKHLPAAAKKREPIGESLKSGIRFVFSQKVLISAISLDLFAVLFGGAVALLPAFADQILHAGPEGTGILRSAPAVGAVMMSIFQAWYPPRKNAGRKMILYVALFGLSMIGFALSTWFWLSFTFLLLSGMFDNVSVVIRSTILQMHTPDEMRGRVAAVNSIFVGSSNEIGSFESGLMARIMGLVPSVIFGGCMTLLVTGSTWKLAPELKELEL